MTTASGPIASSTNLFRRLAWQSTIPLEIRLAENEPGAGSGADRYYMYAPRYTYLPLLIPEIRENLVELCLDDQEMAETNEAEWWFEEETSGGFAPQGPCRWHWPLDLIHLHSVISHPAPITSTPNPSTPGPSKRPFKPLRLLLHLSNPPADKLLLPNSIEVCKAQFMNQLKEADFVRWRNTSRVTNMRRPDLDAGWEGILMDDYEMYMRMAARLIPLPVSTPPTLTPARPAPTDPSGAAKPAESSYSVRSLPIKLYLPDDAPVIQDIVPPIGSGGRPATVLSLLHAHLPLLFPPTSVNPYSMAYPIAQGVEIPPESELAWLSACLCGADGWLRIGIRLVAEA